MMGPTKIYRDESTPDRKEIWTFVELAAARASDTPNVAEDSPIGEQDLAKSRVNANGSSEE